MSESIGKLIIRLMVGGLLLFHGVHKALYGIAPIKGMLAAGHLPEIFAYGVYVGEVLAPIFLLIGWKSRWWAAIVVFNMSVAIYLTKWGTLFTLNPQGGWSIELPLLFGMGALAIVFLGSGRYAILHD
ncbi:MAG: DoxX family protein [Campylobacterales bacterium]|nr:DoxX family protein [Campylobacterales bacterium]